MVDLADAAQHQCVGQLAFGDIDEPDDLPEIPRRSTSDAAVVTSRRWLYRGQARLGPRGRASMNRKDTICYSLGELSPMQKHTGRRPLLLRGNLRTLPKSSPLPGTFYDAHRQLWTDAQGIPIVAQTRGQSDFGETSRTDSHEGLDQSEISFGIHNSDFGETTITKTSEGMDATEIVDGLAASDFGETTITRTTEGVDTTEAFMGSDFGETTKTATAEGSDQTEATEDCQHHP